MQDELLYTLIGIHILSSTIIIAALGYILHIALTHKPVKRQLLCMSICLVSLYLFCLSSLLALEAKNPYWNEITYVTGMILGAVDDLSKSVAIGSLIQYAYIILHLQEIYVRFMPFAPIINIYRSNYFWWKYYLLVIGLTAVFYCFETISDKFNHWSQYIITSISIILSLYLTVVGVYMAILFIQNMGVLNRKLAISNVVILLLLCSICVSDPIYDTINIITDQVDARHNIYDTFVAAVAAFIAIFMILLCKQLKLSLGHLLLPEKYK